MSETIMSVQELIDTAFPDEITNSTINLKLLKTVIVIIANQLRVLNRQVQVNVGNSARRSQTSLRASQVVSEIKLQVKDINKLEGKPDKDGKGKQKEIIKKRKDEKKRSVENKWNEEKEQYERQKELDEDLKSINTVQFRNDSTENAIGRDEGPGIQEGASIHDTKVNMHRVSEIIKYITDIVKPSKASNVTWNMTSTDATPVPSYYVIQGPGYDRYFKPSGNINRFGGATGEGNKDNRPGVLDTKVQKAKRIRADSHEDPALSPSPMASVHSFGKESLLIVSPQGRTPRINVVTKEQFDELANIVHELEARFDPIGIPNFPENSEFLKALRSGASLTEAMAAFQLSTRLKTIEKAFEIMLSLLTELAKNTPGVNVSRFKDLETNFMRGVIYENSMPVREERVNDWISREEFNNAMHELYEEVVEIIKKNSKTGTVNKNAEMLINQLERKMESLNYADRIRNLEEEITEYAEKFIHLDISLSSQIGSYQEQLTQLQYQLDTGIENMIDKVSHVRTAPEALKELNMRLDALQQDLETAIHDGNDLRAFQNNMTFDLARLWKEIELIRDAKADREEMTDALRDKAGIENLNGMVSTGQFDAVRADIEVKINASYNKFNNQEHVWQLALDDLDKSIREKADWVHLFKLRDDISNHLNNLQDRVNGLIEVVGEPRAAAIRKKLFSDADCACCGTPANMNMVVPVQRLPVFKRASAYGAEAQDMPKEDGDHSALCVQDRPVLRGSRTHICQRFCGGSHTIIPRIPPLTRAPPGVTITHLPRETTTTIGSDGKAYKTDQQIELKPCGPCNAHKDAPQPLENTNASEPADKERTSSFDIMGEMTWLSAPKLSGGSEYPPLPLFDDEM